MIDTGQSCDFQSRQRVTDYSKYGRSFAAVNAAVGRNLVNARWGNEER